METSNLSNSSLTSSRNFETASLSKLFLRMVMKSLFLKIGSLEHEDVLSIHGIHSPCGTRPNNGVGEVIDEEQLDAPLRPVT